MACGCRAGCSCGIVGTPPVLVSPDLEVSLMGTDPAGFVIDDPEGMKYFESAGPVALSDTEVVALAATVTVTPNVPYVVSLEWMGAFDSASVNTRWYTRFDVIGVQQDFAQRQGSGQAQYPLLAERQGRITNIWQTYVVPLVSPITIDVLVALDEAGATASLRAQNLIVETRAA